MQNWSETILSQYANSPTINALIESINDAIDPSTDIENFYQYVWNVLTAVGSALDDVWGPIVGVSRVLTIPGGNDFGFKEEGIAQGPQTGQGALPFGQGTMYTGVQATTNYALSDTAFRTLILAKALSNISSCSISTYNTILMQLFPNRGNAYVSNGGNMNARLTFEFTLQPFELAIIKQSGALPPPTGVEFEVMEAPRGQTFGFNEAGAAAAPWNVGVYFAGFS
jgi:hypothetical protein